MHLHWISFRTCSSSVGTAILVQAAEWKQEAVTMDTWLTPLEKTTMKMVGCATLSASRIRADRVLQITRSGRTPGIPKTAIMVMLISMISISLPVLPPATEKVRHPDLHPPSNLVQTNKDEKTRELIKIAGTQPPTVRDLDQSEQNYEEQAVEAAAVMQGVQRDNPPKKKKDQPQDEGSEDTFRINLDHD